MILKNTLTRFVGMKQVTKGWTKEEKKQKRKETLLINFKQKQIINKSQISFMRF